MRINQSTMMRRAVAALAAVAMLVLPALAHAAGSADWVQPGTGLMENLESGLVQIGAIVIGIGVIIVGIWACFSGHLKWERLGYVILGGVLVMAGPSMIRALLESVQT